MDKMLTEITELLKRTQELIDKRNRLVAPDNKIYNANIGYDGITMLMSSGLPVADDEKIQRKPYIDDEGDRYNIESQVVNGVEFHSFARLENKGA